MSMDTETTESSPGGCLQQACSPTPAARSMAENLEYVRGYRCAAMVFGLLLIAIPAIIAALTGCPPGRWWMTLLAQLSGFALGWISRGLAHEATQSANDKGHATDGAREDNQPTKSK